MKYFLPQFYWDIIDKMYKVFYMNCLVDSSQQLYELSSIILSILQIRKLKLIDA